MAWVPVQAIMMAASTAGSVYTATRKSPSPPKPQAPAPKIDDLMDIDPATGLKKRKGRAETILAGDLIPTGTGKKQLLG